MNHPITQRELRNDSGAVLEAVEEGESFIVTRNGTPVAQLNPLKPRAFVTRDELAEIAAEEPALDSAEFFADLDRIVDQDGLLGE
ncbi:prevent-host-death family protein [Halopolyspora algeriensis]|uniref:Prevent-host-death family protein n=1 Tax=Halopolyspora algeriensis TaxID=1500506 RepID=A0A368VVH3_9ACTN|nr:type II toxin-antitoxin system prevent-host-death family antitoxin [Halopolyspora algeriensis]RCW45203.1 prevent-host-death family protein [Halopolyspora algeriensis]TQM53078.1 prevent-host-death family protein [Halopolyspora algeriensis]